MATEGKIDEFIRDSCALIGKVDADAPFGWDVANMAALEDFTGAIAEASPMYTDAEYAATTMFGCLTLPPTFLAAVREPVSQGAFSRKDYGLANFINSVEFEWFDIIRIMDKFTSELKLYSVSEKNGTFWVKPKHVAVLESECSYWNQHRAGCRALVGKGRGAAIMIPLKRGEEMLIDRTELYVYSDKEIEKICKDLDSEAPPRGIMPLYWEDVDIGDKLPTLVKGPLFITETLNFAIGQGKERNVLLGPSVYWDLKNRPGDRRTEPTTGWPYWDAHMEPTDQWACKLRGMPTVFDTGIMRVCLAGQVVTNWMGDEGFLRRLSVETPKPWIESDTMWLSGEVTDKYKEKIGGEMYRAVDVKIEGKNQLGETIAFGTATIYLPSAGFQVTLPIPQ